MSQRLFVSPPDGNEELRAWAEAVSDLHHTGDLIADKADLFIPGEEEERVLAAWKDATPEFQTIVTALDPYMAAQPGKGKITATHLTTAKLN